MFRAVIYLIFSISVTVSSALNCNDGTVRGVNLGGWLLLEPWITPSIFEEVNVGENHLKVVDEYTYAQYVDPVFAKERLERHWNEFYQQSDIEALAEVGISHIRIPYGYWLVDVAEDEPFPTPPANDTDGQRFYLKRMIQWAEQSGIKVLLDLHGGPGSQNGFDNSGKRGEVHWHEGENPDRTVRILGKVAMMVKQWIDEGAFKLDTIEGLELLNEPAGFYDWVWNVCKDNFYSNGYDEIRKVFPDSEKTLVSIQQAFRGYGDFNGVLPHEQYSGVQIDLHEYQCFGGYWNDLAEQNDGWWAHLGAACAHGNDVEQIYHDSVTGEFSLAVTDCQKYLDGGYADPYVAPAASAETCAYYNSDFGTFTEDYKDFLKNFFLAQIDGFEKGDRGVGWYFWTAKTENNCAPEWDFLFLVQNGIIPQDLCSRQSYCTY